MDYTEMLRDSFAYMRQGVLGNGIRWMKLILAIILLAIPINGYLMRIYRGAAPAPEADHWGGLCIDGLKLMIVSFVYAIPILLVWFLAYGQFLAAILAGHLTDVAMMSWKPDMALVALMYVFEIAVALVMPVVAIRFARSNSFGEAFRFRAILDHIASLGWINYVLGVILITVIVAVPVIILTLAGILLAIVFLAATGFSSAAILATIAAAVVVVLIVMPPLMVFQARFWTRLYDGAAIPSP